VAGRQAAADVVANGNITTDQQLNAARARGGCRRIDAPTNVIKIVIQ